MIHRSEGNLDVFSYNGREIVITPEPRVQDSKSMVYFFRSGYYEGKVTLEPINRERVADDLPTRIKAAQAAFNEIHSQIRQSLYKKEA